MQSSRSEPYLPQLDALRGFAILAVMAQHFLPAAMIGGIIWGRLGVKLFFVISGFLITAILLRLRRTGVETNQSRGRLLSRFYVRRALRLAPIYYGMLLLVASVHSGVAHDLWWHCLYLSNISFTLPNSASGPVAHVWSLSVEEQFYLLWPWMVVFAPWRSLRWISIATIASGPAYRYVAWRHGWNHALQLWQLPACSDSLGIGSVIALARAGIWPWFRPKLVFRWALAIGLPWTAYAYLQDPNSVALVVLGDCGSSLLFAWLVWGGAAGYDGWMGRVLGNGLVIGIGKVSYGLYIYHYILPFFWNQVLAPRWGLPVAAASLPSAVVFTAISFALATASWRWIEQPILHLKKYFPYRLEDNRRVE